MWYLDLLNQLVKLQAGIESLSKTIDWLSRRMFLNNGRLSNINQICANKEIILSDLIFLLTSNLNPPPNPVDSCVTRANKLILLPPAKHCSYLCPGATCSLPNHVLILTRWSLLCGKTVQQWGMIIRKMLVQESREGLLLMLLWTIDYISIIALRELSNISK